MPGAQPAKADVNAEVRAAAQAAAAKARAAGQTAAGATPLATGPEPLADLQWARAQGLSAYAEGPRTA